MTPDEIAARMTGRIDAAGPGRAEAFLSSPVVHNHAAFLQWLPDGTLACAWFGGTLEGRSDIFIHLATLAPGADAWSPADRVSDDPDRSEQNPVIFTDPATGAPGLFHTAQPGGRQEECVVRYRPLLPRGGRRPVRRAADARPAEGQLRPGAGDAPRRRRLDAAALPLPHRPRRALDRQPRRRRRGDEHRPRRNLGPRRGAGVDRLRAHDPGAARRGAHRRLLPAAAGGFRLPDRERRRRPQLVGAGGDRRAEQQLLDRRRSRSPTGGSRCSATRSTPRSPRRAASRSTTSSARATTAAAIPPAAFRRSGACPARR